MGGEVIYTGTGCLLIKREVFDLLKMPYFRSDIRWTPYNYRTTVKIVGSMLDKTGYGLHDVTFGIKLYQAGVKIKVVGRCGQRKLLELGKQGTNAGAHRSEKWTKIKKNYQYNKIMQQPLALSARSTLVTLETPTGSIKTTPKHAKSLIRQKLATLVDDSKVIIDDSEVKWQRS